MSLERLIDYHLTPVDTASSKRLITFCTGYFLKEVVAYIDTQSGETFYDIPYDRLTELVFQTCYDDFEKNQLNDLKSEITEKIRAHLNSKGIPEAILSLLKDMPLKDGETLEAMCSKHIIACYGKFVGHLGLAVIQKKFILGAAQQAKSLAEQAHSSSKESLDKSKEALSNAINAKEEASGIGQNITTQFVTILGIFAAIIVALFGGMSLVKATVDLLMKEGSLPKFMLIISVLMLCFMTLIGLLTSWISAINTGKDNTYKIYKIIVFTFFLIVLILSALLIHY